MIQFTLAEMNETKGSANFAHFNGYDFLILLFEIHFLIKQKLTKTLQLNRM